MDSKVFKNWEICVVKMMNKITLGKLFELYVDTFDKFGLHLLDETNQMMEYYIFEATDINIGFCSKPILIEFLEEGIIDEEILEKSSLLLDNFRKLEDGMPVRDAESVRKSFEWKQLMEWSDDIKKLINNKWTNEELKEIFSFDQPVNFSD